jgi:hypothetical protein
MKDKNKSNNLFRRFICIKGTELHTLAIRKIIRKIKKYKT